MRTLDLHVALARRLIAVASAATLAGCGGSDSSSTGEATPGGAGGAAGGGGSATAGAGGAAGAGAGGAPGAGGAAGAGAGAGGGGKGAAGGAAGTGGGAAGGSGGGGVAGSAGAGGAAVVCAPATGAGDDGAAPLFCQKAGPVGPQPGCSTTEGTGGPVGCYSPGASGSPSDTCLPMSDPSLLMLLSAGCGGIATAVGSAPECRKAAPDMGAPPVLSCCYSVTFQATCQARPLLMGSSMRVAKPRRRADWA